MGFEDPPIGVGVIVAVAVTVAVGVTVKVGLGVLDGSCSIIADIVGLAIPSISTPEMVSDISNEEQPARENDIAITKHNFNNIALLFVFIFPPHNLSALKLHTLIIIDNFI
jgi:hypothetical protein